MCQLFMGCHTQALFGTLLRVEMVHYHHGGAMGTPLLCMGRVGCAHKCMQGTRTLHIAAHCEWQVDGCHQGRLVVGQLIGTGKAGEQAIEEALGAAHKVGPRIWELNLLPAQHSSRGSAQEQQRKHALNNRWFGQSEAIWE